MFIGRNLLGHQISISVHGWDITTSGLLKQTAVSTNININVDVNVNVNNGNVTVNDNVNINININIVINIDVINIIYINVNNININNVFRSSKYNEMSTAITVSNVWRDLWRYGMVAEKCSLNVVAKAVVIITSIGE